MKPTYDQLMAVVELAAEELILFDRDDAGNLTLAICCNDTFAPAADAEEIPWEEVERLRDICKEDPKWGGTRWCMERRKEDPMPKIKKAMKERPE